MAACRGWRAADGQSRAQCVHELVQVRLQHGQHLGRHFPPTRPRSSLSAAAAVASIERNTLRSPARHSDVFNSPPNREGAAALQRQGSRSQCRRARRRGERLHAPGHRCLPRLAAGCGSQRRQSPAPRRPSLDKAGIVVHHRYDGRLPRARLRVEQEQAASARTSRSGGVRAAAASAGTAAAAGEEDRAYAAERSCQARLAGLAGGRSRASRECHPLTGPQPCSRTQRRGPRLKNRATSPKAPPLQHRPASNMPGTNQERNQQTDTERSRKQAVSAPSAGLRGGDAQRFDRRVAHAAVVRVAARSRGTRSSPRPTPASANIRVRSDTRRQLEDRWSLPAVGRTSIHLHIVSQITAWPSTSAASSCSQQVDRQVAQQDSGCCSTRVSRKMAGAWSSSAGVWSKTGRRRCCPAHGCTRA